MHESSDELAEAVAQAVLAKYAELPKNGKPSPTEWTILAGLAASRPAGGGEEVAVVALATGSKCLGAGKLRPDGRALHDSHAEVLARRSLVHFLQTQLLLLSELGEASAANDDCILQWAPVYGLSPNRETAPQHVSGALLADCNGAVAFGATK
jgi:tRNA-specific adenosine deaminase 1